MRSCPLALAAGGPSAPGSPAAAEHRAGQEIRAGIQALFPRLLHWHRYLATGRDPEASGLVTAYHPWEGTDNSPRWDRALARIEAPRPGPYTRLDTSELGDPAQRPTNWDYDRYLWLVGLLREYRYDDEQIHRHYPFQIKDVFFSAVLVAANAALLDLAGVAAAGDGDRAEVAGPLDRGRPGLARRFDAESGLCADDDVRAREQIRLRTFAGFAPLFARTADAGQRAARLLWRSLTELGCADRAAGLRRHSLAQVTGAGECNEYFDPFTGVPLGSPRQSWTAAVVLDWAALPP
jgi:hypothetical protein